MNEDILPTTQESNIDRLNKNDKVEIWLGTVLTEFQKNIIDTFLYQANSTSNGVRIEPVAGNHWERPRN